jgi:hypothetical protein
MVELFFVDRAAKGGPRKNPTHRGLHKKFGEFLRKGGHS